MNERKVVDLPVTIETDVVVVGAGGAGVVAALAAARNGAKTLLIERAGYLGGMITGGLIDSLNGYRLHRNYDRGYPMFDWSTPLVIKGISLEVITRVQKANGSLYPDHIGDPSVRENIDPEVAMCVLDEMMEEAGVTVLYNTVGFGAIKEGDGVKGVMIANKSGGQIVKAKVVVDASADADIAANAGVEYEYGTPEGPFTHGGSLMIEIGGIDVDKLIAYLKSRPQLSEEQRAELEKDRIELLMGGEPPEEPIISLDGTRGRFSMTGKKQSWDEVENERAAGRILHIGGFDAEWIAYIKAHPDIPYMPNTHAKRPMYPRAPGFNWYGLVKYGKLRYDQSKTGVHEMFFNQTDELETSRAIMLMRKINLIYLRFLQECIPGCEDTYIMKSSPLVGSRESRRIIGEYVLTAEDAVNGAQFDDVIGFNGRALSKHNLKKHVGPEYWIEPKEAYSLPYRMLLPKRIDNLLVAGRCSSADYLASGSIRGIPACMALGEAAGAAAALSATQNIKPRDLDIGLLQKKLKEQGVLLP